MQVTIYIRKENEGKWNDIADKSVWVNTLLANSDSTRNYGKKIRTPAGPAVTVLAETIPGVVKGADFVPKPPDPETGYPCCMKRKPCRHWQWNSGQEAWVNELTGKTRDPDIL